MMQMSSRKMTMTFNSCCTVSPTVTKDKFQKVAEEMSNSFMDTEYLFVRKNNNSRAQFSQCA